MTNQDKLLDESNCALRFPGGLQELGRGSTPSLNQVHCRSTTQGATTLGALRCSKFTQWIAVNDTCACVHRQLYLNVEGLDRKLCGRRPLLDDDGTTCPVLIVENSITPLTVILHHRSAQYAPFTIILGNRAQIPNYFPAKSVAYVAEGRTLARGVQSTASGWGISTRSRLQLISEVKACLCAT
jgi:hypothetical protein